MKMVKCDIGKLKKHGVILERPDPPGMYILPIFPIIVEVSYGLKQAAKAFWRQLLPAASAMGLKQSTTDPCFYFKWVNGWLIMMMSWIDDNAIVGQESDVMELKKALLNQFECKDCGPMDEYVGCMIEKLKTGGVKFGQKFLLQSCRDEFDILKLKKFNTPAAPGTVLRKPDEGEEILMPGK